MWFLPFLLICSSLAQQTVVKAPTFTINLDLPPQERWVAVATHYKSEASAIAKYFYAQLPKEIAYLVEAIARSLRPLFGEYGEEMESIAKAMDIDTGLVVVLNYIYEFRDTSAVGHPNNTGGYTPPKGKYLGLCTSVVAQNPSNSIWHGRNLDWNLPDAMRALTFQCNFTKGGKVLYVGACYGGYIGIMTGMKPSNATENIQGFSLSLDARNLGGNPVVDVLASILEGAADPTHYARTVLEEATSFTQAQQMLSKGHIAAPIYYILSGGESGQGVVLTRDRLSLADAWELSEKQWYLLETNYDHWLEPPEEDNRRAWGNYFMNQLGKTNINKDSLFKVMSTWPINNNFTSYTSMASVKDNSFGVWVRYGHNPPPPH